MAQSSRLYGAHIDVFSIGGTSYVGLLSNLTVHKEFDTQEAVALKDVDHYPVGIRQSWEISGDMFVDTSAAVMITLIAGLQVAIILETGPSTSADRYTGNALLTAVDHDLPDGPQTQRFTLTGQGALTRGASI